MLWRCMASRLTALCRLISHTIEAYTGGTEQMHCICDVMFNGYTKMHLLDTLIGHILDIHQMHWTQTHQTHFRTARQIIIDNCSLTAVG